MGFVSFCVFGLHLMKLKKLQDKIPEAQPTSSEVKALNEPSPLRLSDDGIQPPSTTLRLCNNQNRETNDIHDMFAAAAMDPEVVGFSFEETPFGHDAKSKPKTSKCRSCKRKRRA